MSNEQNPIVKVFEIAEKRFNEAAPAYMKYETEVGFAKQLMDSNAYLKKAAMENPRSLGHAITNVAAIGLSLNPAEKLAYLITRNVKVGKNQWETRVFLDPSYMGLIRLATDSGNIKWMQANCVYSEDEFIDNGPGEKPTHKYNAFSKDRGEFVGVFCVAKTADGDYLTTTMAADEVYSIRDRSEAWKAKVAGRSKHGGPWESDFNEMAKKSVIRRSFKTLPRTDERRMQRLASAVDLSNENEGFEPILTSPGLGQYTAETKAYFDQLLTESNALGMFVFQQTLDDEAAFTNLYHSFEKGQKGKYQRLVDELLHKGRESFTAIVDEIMELLVGDDPAALEIWQELTADEQGLVAERLTPEQISQIESMKQTAA